MIVYQNTRNGDGRPLKVQAHAMELNLQRFRKPVDTFVAQVFIRFLQIKPTPKLMSSNERDPSVSAAPTAS